MALTIAGAVDASAYLARFHVAGGTAPYRLQAFPTGGTGYTVRTQWTPTGGGLDAMDGDIPLGVATTYVVTDSVGAQAQLVAPLTVTAPGPVLADATTPTTCALVTVVSQPPNEWAARSVWWDILGARAPFVSVAPMRYRNGDLVLRVPDNAARDELLAILTTGAPFTLRTPCRDRVDDLIGLPATLRDELLLPSAPAGPHHLTITYQAVARELGPYAGSAGRTYGIALADAASYAVMANGWATYAAWLAGTPL